jgi:hypothetical protein
MGYLYENDGLPYKLTVNLENEFGFSEFDELPDDGEFENIDQEVLALDFENLDVGDELEDYSDDFEE